MGEKALAPIIHSNRITLAVFFLFLDKSFFKNLRLVSDMRQGVKHDFSKTSYCKSLCDLCLLFLTCQQGEISRYLEIEGVEISGLGENDLLSNLRT